MKTTERIVGLVERAGAEAEKKNMTGKNKSANQAAGWDFRFKMVFFQGCQTN
jgi:hypothetical protein